MKLLSFDDALKNCGASKKHLLLGNGFSIACKPDIFRYNALFENADFESISENLRNAFTVLNTTNFEEVIRALQKAALLATLYTGDSKLASILEKDAENLKNILATTIANNHPESPYEITDAQYKRTKMFLSNFEKIYTVSYDLLLYWTLRHEFDEIVCKDDDGFRSPEENAEYVTWEVENTKQQNIFYLHGALHLFDAGATIKKYTWINTGIKLIDQIREAMSKNYFPIIVAEGTCEKKLEAINHSNYLSRAYRSFSSLGNVLFIYGHSFADNDDHILNLIPKTKVKEIYVGLYGDLDDEINKRIIRKANLLSINRDEKNPLAVNFYDSSTCHIW